MSAEVEVRQATDWILGPEARGLLGVSIQRFAKLIEDGHIGCRKIPGTWPRYDRTDCERLLQESTRPATAKSA